MALAKAFVPLPLLSFGNSAENDAVNLFTETRLSGIQAERTIAIVTRRWFTSYIGGTATGANYPMLREVAFSLDGHPTNAARELGHSYGFADGYVRKPNGDCCLCPGTPTTGFWVARLKDVTNALDYMGNDPGDIVYPDGANQRWSSTDHFAALFRQFLVNPSDPELLLVTGTISNTNVVTLGQTNRVANGTPSQPQPSGDALITALDKSGTVLAQFPFKVDFTALSDPPSTTDTAPFGFAVPYPAGTAQIRITRNNNLLASFSPTSKLLSDAVASIPDAGFVKNPTQTRNALLNKIGALDSQLSTGAINGAINKLKNDIRPHLVDSLVNNYPTSTLLQYSKSGILALADELLTRLG